MSGMLIVSWDSILLEWNIAPPTTAQYPDDNKGHWAAFWHVEGLRELPKEKRLRISKIGSIKEGWRKNAPPRGPELVALPELLSYED